MHHPDGDVTRLRVVLPLEVVVDPRLQVDAQLGVRESWTAREREMEVRREGSMEEMSRWFMEVRACGE